MAIYINGNKVVNSLVIDGQVEGISLVNTCRIGVTASNKAQSPVDANNYIDVSGTTVTLKRNNNTYHLWIYSPQLLQVGKAYAFVFDSITNYDDNYYIEYTSDIMANPIVATRIGYADSDNILNGFVIEPTISAYYGVAIWRNNTNDIVVNNPRFIEIGKNTGGGGSVTPTFSETVLVDNSTLASSFTFSEDYHNYDFIRAKIYNSSYDRYSYHVTTPSSIDAIFSLGSPVMFNEWATNQGVCYSQSGLTWNRTWIRNVNAYEIVGLKCINMTVTETEIYKASSISSTAVTVTTQLDLFDFDWIMFADNDSTYNEVMPSKTIFTKPCYVDDILDSSMPFYMSYIMQDYNNSGTLVYISNHEITAGKFLYIVGIKFT